MLGLAFLLEEIRLFFIYILFLILHELSHFFVAKKLGYLAKKIHLSFFGASLEGLDDFNVYDELKIILAGPLFNLFVIVLCYLSFWFYPESYHYLNDILVANLSILTFNLVPIYPLDMGRLIHSALSIKFNRKTSLRATKTISLFVIIVFFIIFLISFFFNYDFRLGFVCVNLFCLLFSSSSGTSYKRVLFAQRKYKLISKGLTERNIYIKANTPLFKLFKYIDDYHFVNFIFLNDSLDVERKITEIELYKELNLF